MKHQVLLLMCFGACISGLRGQAVAQDSTAHTQDLQQRVEHLESEVKELRAILRQMQSRNETLTQDPATDAGSSPRAAPSQTLVSSADGKTLDFLHDTTLNLTVDGYYAYNFNNPVGRVDLLRAYDVLSNEFSLNQASVILERAPDLGAGRRWGARLDLQYGQATDTLQGNPANEPRPQIYRNIFQAYGTYIVPLGKGLTVDFGKWSSSLGIEGNYTKDQVNYSRSFYFDFLPFYHMGIRASYPINDQLTLNYWVVNGTNQVEATNGFKDQLFGFTAKPRKSINWTTSYYLGQEHPDRAVVPPSHSAGAGWVHSHLRQLCDLANHAEADAGFGRRLRDSASVAKCGAGSFFSPFPRRRRRCLCTLSVHPEGRTGGTGRIPLGSRRILQRHHSGAERKYRHFRLRAG
jgi:hypothetical protein